MAGLPESPTPETWRLFVAVPLPWALRGALAEQPAPLQGSAPEGIRWTDPASWHVTLAFLGDTDPARVPDLVAALRTAVAPLPAFTAQIGGLGVFPNPGTARVVWLGVDGGDALRHLAAVVADACGIDRAEPFRAHLTVARLRRRTSPPCLDGEAQRVRRSLPVREVRLMRSRAGARQTRYVVLDNAPLLATDVG